jgi:hypothetical protein
MGQPNAPLEIPGPVIATSSRLITYSLEASTASKTMPGSVPSAGTITSVSVSIVGDDSAGAEDVVLTVRNAAGATTNSTTLATAPVTVPSFVQTNLSVPVAAGDFFTVSYGNSTFGFLAIFVTIELDAPI